MDLTIADTHAMQELCAYEVIFLCASTLGILIFLILLMSQTVALGYSAFCPLFTKKEWRGFQYGFDLSFWYGSGFGSPVAAAQGAGYANELLHRLKRLLPMENPFSVNQTLDGNEITFPLDQSIYVDATHEVRPPDIFLHSY
jgi:Histidine phosphatase superfamily (branch 2)